MCATLTNTVLTQDGKQQMMIGWKSIARSSVKKNNIILQNPVYNPYRDRFIMNVQSPYNRKQLIRVILGTAKHDSLYCIVTVSNVTKINILHLINMKN